jgi:hypothetical protein
MTSVWGREGGHSGARSIQAGLYGGPHMLAMWRLWPPGAWFELIYNTHNGVCRLWERCIAAHHWGKVGLGFGCSYFIDVFKRGGYRIHDHRLIGKGGMVGFGMTVWKARVVQGTGKILWCGEEASSVGASRFLAFASPACPFMMARDCLAAGNMQGAEDQGLRTIDLRLRIALVLYPSWGYP